MKITSKALSLAVLISAALLVGNCGGEGSETPVEKVQLGKLKKTWELFSATMDEDPSDQIDSDFTLTISGTFDKDSPEGPYSFEVSGTQTPSPWPGDGTWEFGPDPESQIIRSDGVVIEYSINSNGRLTMRFQCNTCNFTGAKTSNVNGFWEFVLD